MTSQLYFALQWGTIWRRDVFNHDVKFTKSTPQRLFSRFKNSRSKVLLCVSQECGGKREGGVLLHKEDFSRLLQDPTRAWNPTEKESLKGKGKKRRLKCLEVLIRVNLLRLIEAEKTGAKKKRQRVWPIKRFLVVSSFNRKNVLRFCLANRRKGRLVDTTLFT